MFEKTENKFKKEAEDGSERSQNMLRQSMIEKSVNKLNTLGFGQSRTFQNKTKILLLTK